MLGVKIVDPLMLGPLSDLRFIDAKYAAKAMAQKMDDNSEGLSVLKYKDFVNAYRISLFVLSILRIAFAEFSNQKAEAKKK